MSNQNDLPNASYVNRKPSLIAHAEARAKQLKPGAETKDKALVFPHQERVDFFARLRSLFEAAGVNMSGISDDDVLLSVNRMQAPSVESQKVKNDVAGDFAGFGWQSQTPPDNEAVVVERIVTELTRDFPQFPRSGIQTVVRQVRKEYLFDPYTPNLHPSHHE